MEKITREQAAYLAGIIDGEGYVSIQANQVQALLPEVLPYLICKKQQAELVLDYISKTKRPGCRGLTIEALELRETFYQEARRLNKKGI